ncbi:hypothetical protein Q4Q39_15635 [Flavivirga amylovorans]|uniref:Peptidase C39-like domain-containing protein n=1 Tax=Flavivirga amylovorans TaxID=870486 RepID=A0ABT8X4R6_9FLAO|nr:hypothetical protein [Flavivirga amylovorans]MDO5988842.1 hypothetical protein [Flavivirga amylovorans]
MNISPIRAEGKLPDVKFLIKDIGKKIKNNDFMHASNRINQFFHINNFKEDLFCNIEYPYVDSHYRDSFYFYHSSKNYHVEKDCIRISFFDTPFNLDNPFSDLINGLSTFLGILVIRPTRNNQFGRMILSPNAFTIPPIEIICRKYYFTVRGIKLNVEAFQNSGQDNELHTCSETSLLSVLNYFSKYDHFKDKTPSKIFSVIDSLRYENIEPGKGMKQNEISFVLKEFGFGVRSYSRTNNNAEGFKKAFNDYIESGLPVITVFSQIDEKSKKVDSSRLENVESLSNGIAHSVIYIGYMNSQIDDFKIKANSVSFNKFNGTTILDYINSLTSNRKYVFIDDNQAPYRIGGFYNPLNSFDKKNILFLVLLSP